MKLCSGKKGTVAAGKGSDEADKDKLKDKDRDKDKAGAKVKKEFVSEDENYYYYKVRSWEKYEDCLSRIALKYYKNAKLWGRIHKANNIKNPDIIQPGQIIKVPKIKK
jgi:nucleoid-associated protein YgaU